MNYQGNLINSLELILYKDRTRSILSTQDDDVLQIFSGDLRAAIVGLHDFAHKHADKTVVIQDIPGILEVKVFSLYSDPEESIRKEKYIESRTRKRRYERW